MMANDDRNSGLDNEGGYFSQGSLLGFLLRNSLTIALVFIILLPVLNLLPENLYDFTLDHRFLLVGPLFVIVPVFLAYFVNWGQLRSRKNIFILAGLLIFGFLSMGVIIALGTTIAQFICPDGYPFTQLPDLTSVKGKSRGQYITIICYGKLGVHEIPSGIVDWVTYYLFLVSGLLSAGVSFFFGNKSLYFGRAGDSDTLHLPRYFLMAMVLSVGFLSLPETISGGNFLAGIYESSGSKRSLKEGKEYGWASPLHGAVLAGKLSRVKTLLKEGANVNSVINKYLTPLAVAVKKQNPGMVRMLVDAGAKVNIGERFGYSAMQHAIRANNKEMIAYLQKHGGNRLPIGKGSPKTLITAVKKLDLEAARKLLEKGANPNTRTKYKGKSLLFRTIFEVNTDGYKRPRGDQIKSLKMARLLLKHGAKLESRARYRETPLVYAIQFNNIWMVKLFLEHGAKVNALDDKGRNSLYHAVRGRFFREEILDILMKKGVNINHKDKRGQTALIGITEHGSFLWSMQWLVDQGADVNVVDKGGQTALDKLGKNNLDNKKREILLLAGAKSALTL